MFFTILYMAATLIQSLRLRSIYSKLSKQIIERGSVVFYRVPQEVNDISQSTVSSELCSNHLKSVISDVFWFNGDQRGCCIFPIQNINLSSWISFPMNSTPVPIDCKTSLDLRLDETNLIYVLLETDMNPIQAFNQDALMIENFGIPMAWRVDTNIALLLKSDYTHFIDFILASFLQNQLLLNDNLPLKRIETVITNGNMQPFELLMENSHKDQFNRCASILSLDQWITHLNAMRNLSVRALEAAEYEEDKLRVEINTSSIKPDLISSKNIEDSLRDKNIKSPESPIKVVEAKLIPKISPMKIEKSPVASSELFIHVESVSIAKSPIEMEGKISSKFEETPLKTEQAKSEVKEVSIKPSPVPLKELDIIFKPPPKLDSPIKPAVKSEIPPSNKPEKKPTNDIIKPKLPLMQTKLQDKEKLPPKKEDILISSASVSATAVSSSIKVSTKRPSLKRTKKSSLISSKPPNILVYSESIATRDSVIATLKKVLEDDMYTIYPLTIAEVNTRIWIENAALLIVCGNVEPKIGDILLDYYLKGGKMLCLCSDVLHTILPTYRTAEVREHELVQFSYGKWQKVKMMHHIFCYQPSPVRKHFSHDNEEPYVAPSKPVIVCPRSVDVNDLQGNPHTLQVQVLGTEETWNTPSLMLASDIKNGGKALFSQIHLETDPSLYENDETKFNVLKKNDVLRLEILSDLLSTHLGMTVTIKNRISSDTQYSSAYFLGRHEIKIDLMNKLKSHMVEDNVIKNDLLTIQFCGKGVEPEKAAANVLPVMLFSCPDNFSTVAYFDNLKSESIGRLVIYAPILVSSMNVLKNFTLTHGMAVVPYRQTHGTGRNNNQWLSPDGCLMFSLQLHVPLSSPLGQRLPLVQHLIATAIVRAILTIPGYEELDIKLKWPNDIYANGTTKIGGLIINSTLNATMSICNIGCGLNLSNSNPTVCVNDLIKEYNKRNNKNLSELSYEQLLALIFNEIESIYEQVQLNNMDLLYKFYYQNWLHSDTEVNILQQNGIEKLCKIIGIDEFGYLLVQGKDDVKTESVHPDGNSFDMLRGLIFPKYH